MSEHVWTPSEARVASSNMRAFMDYQVDIHGWEFENYRSLNAWSVEDQAAFWSDFWD